MLSSISAELIKKDKDLQNNMLLTFKVTNNEQKRLLDEELYNNYNNKYTLAITKEAKHRTLSQNALFWKLVSLIAQKQRIDPEEICRQIMIDVQSKYTMVEAPLEAEESLKKGFKFVKFIAVSMTNKERGIFQCFYGTSTLSSEEFSLLIDKAKTYCHELGLPVEEIEQS